MQNDLHGAGLIFDAVSQKIPFSLLARRFRDTLSSSSIHKMVLKAWGIAKRKLSLTSVSYTKKARFPLDRLSGSAIYHQKSHKMDILYIRQKPRHLYKNPVEV